MSTEGGKKKRRYSEEQKTCQNELQQQHHATAVDIKDFTAEIRNTNFRFAGE